MTTTSAEAPDSQAIAPGGDSYPRYRWVMIVQLWAHWASFQLLFQTLGVFLPALREDLSISAQEAGLLSAMRGIGQFLLFPASVVLVFFNANKLYGVLLTVAAGAIFLHGVTPSLGILMVALTLHGIASAWFQIPGAFVRLQWVPPAEMATVNGLQMATGAITASIMFAAGPFLIEQFGWRPVIFMIDGILIAVAASWWLTARENTTERYKLAMKGRLERKQVIATLRRREFWLLGGAIGGGGATYLTMVLFLPSYYTDDRGMSLGTAGLVVGAMQIGGLISSLTTGVLSDRLGYRKPFIWIAGLVLPFLYGTLLFAGPVAVLIPVALLAGYFAFAPFVVINVIPFELDVPPREVAIGQSLQWTVGTMGQMAFPLIVGTIAGATDSYRNGLLAVFVCPIAFTLICLMLRETGPKKRRAAAALAATTP